MLRKLLPILLLASLLAGLLSSLPAPLPAAAQAAQGWKAAAGLSRFSFADLGQKDIVARAIFDQALVRFPLAAGRRVEQVCWPDLSHDKNCCPAFLNSSYCPTTNRWGAGAWPANAAAAFVEFNLPPALRPGENVLTFWFNLRPRLWAARMWAVLICGRASTPTAWSIFPWWMKPWSLI
jgi:hypothetical protein